MMSLPGNYAQAKSRRFYEQSAWIEQKRHDVKTMRLLMLLILSMAVTSVMLFWIVVS